MKIWMILFFIITSDLAQAQKLKICNDYLVYGTVEKQQTLIVTRYSYLNIASGPSMWFESNLELKNNKKRDGVDKSTETDQFETPTWYHHPNFYQSELYSNPFGDRRALNYFGNPDLILEILLNESTKIKSIEDLAFVYEIFNDESKSRSVFDTDFISQLRMEDLLRIEQSLTIWSVKKLDQTPVAVWGLYRKESTGLPTFELIRMAIRKNENFDIVKAMTFVSDFLLSQSIQQGFLEIKTDKVGARFYQRLGATLINEYEPGKFLLKVEISKFLNLFPAIKISNGSRPVFTRTMFDEIIYY